jgi:hypothetical protein
MERWRRQKAMEGLLLDGTVWFKCYVRKENLAIQPKRGQKPFEQSLASSQHGSGNFRSCSRTLKNTNAWPS